MPYLRFGLKEDYGFQLWQEERTVFLFLAHFEENQLPFKKSCEEADAKKN